MSRIQNPTQDEDHLITLRIAELIQKRREEMGLSQQTVADCLNVSFQQIQKYENGSTQLSPAKLERVCGILGVPIDYFITGAPLDVMLPPKEYALIEAWRNMDEKHRWALEEIAYALATHENMP